MTEYRWKGIDEHGAYRTGTMTAPSPEALRQQLYDQGIALLDHRQPYFKKILNYPIASSTISLSDFAFFFQHISILLEHGIPLLKALQTTALHNNSRELKNLIARLIPHIHHGKSFAQALETEAAYIPAYIRLLIMVGEKTDSLSVIFKKLGAHLHSTQELKRKTKRALLIPAVTGAFALLVTLLILLFIIPHFEELFKNSHLYLPPITQRIFFLSGLLKKSWGLILLGIPMIFMTLARFSQHRLKQWAYSFSLKIPYLKNILFASLSLTFLETLSLYVQAGLPLVQGLEQAQTLMAHPGFCAALQSITASVLHGNSLEHALEQSTTPLCTPTVISLIGVGEKTGTLDQMLENSVIWQRQELSKQLNLISSLANPALMIVLGCVVTALLVTIYLPIFNMATVPLT